MHNQQQQLKLLSNSGIYLYLSSDITFSICLQNTCLSLIFLFLYFILGWSFLSLFTILYLLHLLNCECICLVFLFIHINFFVFLSFSFCLSFSISLFYCILSNEEPPLIKCSGLNIGNRHKFVVTPFDPFYLHFMSLSPTRPYFTPYLKNKPNIYCNFVLEILLIS